MSKVIITAAITGSFHTPSMSPYLPITPQQLSDEAVAACEAGAAIVHTHVRDPKIGRPSANIELFKEVFSNTRKRCNVILCPSTGGGGMSLEQKTETVHVLKPEMASLNCGSINILLSDLAKEVQEWKFDWEKPYLEAGYDRVFQNTFKSVVEMARVFAENGTDPDCELHDLGMINNLAYLIEQGVINKPVHVNFSMGQLGQAPATVENLVFFVRMARELISDFRFTASAPERKTIALQAAAMAMGGDARVGMEDSLYVGKERQLAKSNAEQVREVVQIAESLGREVATPDEAREILGLKGLDKVDF